MSSSLYLCSACIVIVQEHDGLALFPICTTTNERERRKREQKLFFVFYSLSLLDIKFERRAMSLLNIYCTVQRKREEEKKSAVKWREPPHSRLLALVPLEACGDLSVSDEGEENELL